MNVVFRLLNKLGDAFVEPANAEKQLPDNHQVTVSNQISQPVQDGGTVNVGNLPATYPDQHDQPLTDTQLRATAVTVSGTVTATPSGTQDVEVQNFPAEYPLPVAQITTLTPQTNALTDAELRASSVPVDTGLTQPTTPADTQPVRDDYAANEHSPDQLGDDSVLDFDLEQAAFVMVDVDNTDSEDDNVYRARATLDGTDPSASVGFVCRSGATTYLPFPTAGTIKVFAPSGTVVAVQTGQR